MCWLCPMSTPGRPGTLTPVTSKPGAEIATWYHTDGRVCGRCGSPASIDLPPATLGPLAAQALLSGAPWICPRGRELVTARMAAAARATDADGAPAWLACATTAAPGRPRPRDADA